MSPPPLIPPRQADVMALIRVKDAQLLAVGIAFSNVVTDWHAQAKDEADDFARDLTALRTRYAAARARAMGVVRWPPAMTWNDVMRAVRQKWDASTQSGPETKGDLMDLDRRVRAAGGFPDYAKVPTPEVPDYELDMFKRADVAAKAIDKAAQAAKDVAQTAATAAMLLQALPFILAWVFLSDKGRRRATYRVGTRALAARYGR